MTNKRLTIEEMEQKYPNEWLFIVNCEHSENTELLSGRVLVHSKSREMFMTPQRTIRAMRQYVIQAKCKTL